MISSDKITVYLRAKKAGEAPHEAFANLQKDEASFNRFVKTWGRATGQPLFDYFGGPSAEYQDWLQKAWRGDKAAIDKIVRQINQHFRTSMAFDKGRIELIMDDLVGTSFLLFLRDHSAGRTAVCANPACPNPYFVKKRETQKYCGAGPCTEKAQLEYKRNWWRENRGQNKDKDRKQS
jgi:hypothetical protein